MEGLQGILAKEKLAWVKDNKLYYDGAEISGVTLTDGEKKLISMGANIIVYPDQILYNTVTMECSRVIISDMANVTTDTDRDKSLIFLFRLGSGAQKFSSLPDGYPINDSGADISGSYTYKEGNFASATKNIKGKDVTVYYVYQNGAFVPVTTNHLCAMFPVDEVEVELSAYKNGVKFYLGTEKEYSLTCEGQADKSSSIHRLLFDWGKEVSIEDVYGMFENIHTSITSIFPTEYLLIHIDDLIMSYPGQPILDGIFENGNRLWGYRCGENLKGEFVNEIYASELGSPIAWNTFEGIASDSYAVSVGSDGPFTGATYYSGNLFFFKENCIHKIMGSKPASYQLVTLTCNGIEEGSERSLVHLGDSLYYKGIDGIYCFDGSLPYRISDVFGERQYKNAVGGALAERLYMEMESEDGERVLFVYDTLKKLWYKEEAVGAKRFISAYGNLLYETEKGLGVIVGDSIDEVLENLFGDTLTREEKVRWFGEFGDFGLGDPDAKYFSKLQLRMTVDEGARVSVEIMTDSDGSWETVAVIPAQNKRSVCLPIVTPRCDHFRLKLSGEGGFKLWTMVKEIESTNEVR